MRFSFGPLLAFTLAAAVAQPAEAQRRGGQDSTAMPSASLSHNLQARQSTRPVSVNTARQTPTHFQQGSRTTQLNVPVTFTKNAKGTTAATKGTRLDPPVKFAKHWGGALSAVQNHAPGKVQLPDRRDQYAHERHEQHNHWHYHGCDLRGSWQGVLTFAAPGRVGGDPVPAGSAGNAPPALTRSSPEEPGTDVPAPLLNPDDSDPPPEDTKGDDRPGPAR